MLTFFRRIRKGLLGDGATSKYLLYAIGEIALVVIGILIALQINNWNESSKARKQEKKLFLRILSDLKKDDVNIKVCISSLKKQLEVTQQLFRESQNMAAVDPNMDYDMFRWGTQFNSTVRANYQESPIKVADLQTRDHLNSYLQTVKSARTSHEFYTAMKDTIREFLGKNGMINRSVFDLSTYEFPTPENSDLIDLEKLRAFFETDTMLYLLFESKMKTALYKIQLERILNVNNELVEALENNI